MTTPKTVSSPTSQKPLTIFIIEDDRLMAECLARAAAHIFPSQSAEIKTFPDAISATAALADDLPDLILLDVLLNGPDGFTFLNETISYPDTAKIPVILVTSLNLAEYNLEHYGVRAVLNKDTMTPTNIQEAIRTVLAQNIAVRTNGADDAC